MKMGLLQQEVWSCVEPEAQEDADMKGRDDKLEVKREQLAFTYIMLSLSDTVQSVVRKCKTARETWQLLERKYGGKDIKDRLEVRQKLRNLKLTKGDEMIEHLARIQDCMDQLTAAGGELDEEEAILIILESLPKEYDVLKVVLSTREKQVNQDELHSLLLTEERRIAGGKSEKVKEALYYVEGRGKRYHKDKTCYKCSKVGHISRNCQETRAADGALLCRRCQSREHVERECPQRNKDQSATRDDNRKRTDGRKTFSSYATSTKARESLFSC